MTLAIGKTTPRQRCRCAGAGWWPCAGRAGAVSLKGGFTLLEMIVVLAIMGLLTTFFAVSFFDSSEDDGLRKVAAELRTAAQKASRLSETYGGDFYLFLDRSGFGLGESMRVEDSGETALDYSLPKDIRMKLRRYGDEAWIDPKNFAWGFPANGICEPLAIRLERGRSYVEMSFNGLTGRVEREFSYFP